MRQRVRINRARRYRPVALICDEEPGFLYFWNRPSERSAQIGDVEEGIWVLILGRRGRKICRAVFVLMSPCRESRVFIIVNDRSVITRAASLGGDAYIRYAGVFGAEIVGHHIHFRNCIERWLTAGVAAEDASVGPLSIERRASAIALRTDEFEIGSSAPCVIFGLRYRNV